MVRSLVCINSRSAISFIQRIKNFYSFKNKEEQFIKYF